ncbi:MAG: hypothetical protein HOP30_22505 [Cyclobacteriaceae bacterium]|nr:hypothetical protein [Cyclobacteriaceae bacterium]
MSLIDLVPFFDDNELEPGFNTEQIDQFFETFKTDFISNPLMVNGKKIKFIGKVSKIKEYSKYPETFIHIITRSLTNERIYDSRRANRIHWIKPILLSHPCNDVKFYRWKDDDRICKDHYWFFAKDFMVVLKDVSQDLQIVTAFCVDKSQKATFYERFRDFQQGNGNC